MHKKGAEEMRCYLLLFVLLYVPAINFAMPAMQSTNMCWVPWPHPAVAGMGGAFPAYIPTQLPIQAPVPPPPPPLPPSVVQPPMAVYINATNDNKLTSTLATKNQSQIPITPPWYEQAKKYIDNSPYLKYDWFYTHRFKLGAATLLCVYGYIYLLCMRLKNYLNNPALWSTWHLEYSNELLLKEPIASLQKQLILTIQERYVIASQPTNFIAPFAAFISAIDSELATLLWYMRFFEWLKKGYLLKFLPIEENIINILQGRIERLNYLNSLFVQWIAEYKLEKAQHPF